MRPAAAVVALLATAPLVGCAASTEPGADPTLGTQHQVTVYVFDDVGSPRLYPHTVPVDGEATLMEAVDALTTYEPGKPFATLWTGPCALGRDVDGVSVTDDFVTVHFREEAGATCDLSEEGWQMRRQQLAWTVRAATGSHAPVRVTVGEARRPSEEPAVADERYLAPTL